MNSLKIHAKIEYKIYSKIIFCDALECRGMKKSMTSLASLVAVILLSSIILMMIDRFERTTEVQNPIGGTAEHRATVYFVAYAGELPEGRSEEGLKKIGCEDYLVPFEIDVPSRRLKSVLNALAEYDAPEGYYNPIREKGVTVSDVEDRGHSTMVIDLAGTPQFGGVCDTPRFKAQIEETARLYTESFEIRLNGVESKFRCLTDMSGECR